MTVTVSMVSTVLMGALLIGLAAVLAGGKSWRRYTPRLARREGPDPLEDPGVLVTAFFLAVLLVAGGTLFVLGGGELMVVLGLIGAALVAFLAGGIYIAGRSHGHPHSHAVGEAIIAVGAVGLLAVVGWLIAAPWS